MDRFYKWNDKNVVEKYVAESEGYIYFQSGNSVRENEIDSLLHEVSEDEWNAFRATKTPTTDINIKLNREVDVDVKVEENKKEPINPIDIILDKNLKVRKYTLNVELGFESPDIDVINLLLDMFDEDDVLDIIFNRYIKSKILDGDFIKNQFRDYIQVAITNKDN